MNLRILFVEDNPDDAELLIRRLREAGIGPDWERVDAADALREALARERWDVALVDFNLPGFSGPEAIGLLAELAPDTPAITVSGAISEETAVATITAGAVDYVLKDNLTRLAPAVRRAVDGAELRRQQRLAEATLRERDQEFRTLAEAVPQIVWMTDPDGKNTYFNQHWVDYTGMTLEESYGDGWNTPFHPDDRQRAWDAWQRATQDDFPYSVECRLRRADGAYRWWLVRGAPQRDAGGTIVKWFGTCTDIEQIKLAEAKLRRSERNLAEAERIGGAGSWEYDVASDTASWSQNMFRIFDVDPAMPTELVFTHFVESLVHPADRPHVRSVFQDALAGKRPYDLEYRVVKKDGSIRDIHAVAETTRDEHGDALRMIGRVEDITERKQAEEALRESERRFAAFATYIPGRLWIRDSDLRYLYVNPQLAADLGGPESDFLGKTPEELWDGAIATAARALCQRALDGEVVDVTERWPDEASSGFFRSLVFSLPGGEGAGLLGGLMFDVTEQHAAQEEVRRRVEQLDHIIEGSVLAMSQIVETRDPYTAGHERRVAELAVAIGAEMGLGGPKLDGLRLASLIHDIGKISVPAEILAKPGRLSVVEFNLIKQHSQAGHDVLAAIEFQQPVAQIVVQHHERLDGSGYPQGLSGEEIMQEARILAVADVVEAMSSHRPYRPALGMEVALAEVREHAGEKYDADVVTVCGRLIEAEGFRFAP